MISDSEAQSLKFHLQYGSISADAEPCISFVALFETVIKPNLTGGAETSATTAIAAGTATTVTPVSMTDIVANAVLVVDVGTDAELVTVRSVTPTTFTAKFLKAHPASGYPVALMGGVARLRLLLGQADAAWSALQDQSVGATAGLKSVDKSDVEWQPGSRVIKDRQAHYRAIVDQIGSLVRVTPRGPTAAAACTSSY